MVDFFNSPFHYTCSINVISGQLTHNDNRCCVATNLLYLKSPTLSLIFASKVRAVLRDAFGLDQVTIISGWSRSQ